MATPFLISHWYQVPFHAVFEVDSPGMLLPLVWVVWFALQLHTVSEPVYLEAGRILAAVPRGSIVLVPVQSQPLAGGVHFLERAVKAVTCPRLWRCLGRQPEIRLQLFSDCSQRLSHQQPPPHFLREPKPHLALVLLMPLQFLVTA